MAVKSRLATRCALAFACCGVLACGANEAPKPEMAVSQSQSAGSQEQAGSSAGTSPPGPLSLTGEGEERGVVLRVVRSQRGVGLRVINGGTARVSLARRVELRTAEGTAVSVAAGHELVLSHTCKSEGCVSLVPGAEIDAPVWLEQVTNERCGALLVPPAPGSYRLRVQTCTGKQPMEVEFAWPVQ